jgi:hypothetical protein
MTIEIDLVDNKKKMKQFVDFPFKLYRNTPNWIPPLKADDYQTFDPRKNPAFEEADAEFYLALQNGSVVGRIAAIDSHAANKKFLTNNLRFGWFEAIDSYDVAQALFDKVTEYARKAGRETITGPQGFTDFDPQGLLTEGFETNPTIVSGYNHEYYQHFLPQLGYIKDIDYFEFSVDIPEQDPIPGKLKQLAERIRQRSKVKFIEYDKLGPLVKERGHEIFQLLEETFEEIYGAVPLTNSQVDYFIKKYISFVDPRLIKLAVDENNKLIAFLLTMPSMSKAFQKARGSLLPFGWFHLLRALKTYDVLDFYLAGISKKFQGTGIDLLLTMEIAKTAQLLGFKKTESNLELETNTKIQAMWKAFNPKQTRKRRIYKFKVQ